MAWTSSGSAASEVAVNPTRSQNSTATTLRSSALLRSSTPNRSPHSLQNFEASGFSVPQAGQVSTSQSLRCVGGPYAERLEQLRGLGTSGSVGV